MSAQTEFYMECKLARDFTMENVPDSLAYLLIKIMPNPLVQFDRLPVNMSFVIDVSRSMTGHNLKCAIAAVKSIINSLRDNDLISVITFSDTTKAVVKTTSLGDRFPILEAIDRIRIQNGTRMFLGLEESIKEVGKTTSTDKINRIILLTDGQTESEKRCLNVLNIHPDKPVIITIGIGEKYNEELLMSIADITSGEYYHLNNPSKIVDTLQNELRNASDSPVTQSSLNICLSDGVRLENIVRLYPSVLTLKPVMGGKEKVLMIRPGELRKKEPIVIGVRLKLPPRTGGKEHIMQLNLSYSIPGLGVDDKSDHTDIYVTYTRDENLCTRFNREVIDYFNQFDTQKFIWEAVFKTKKGDVNGAFASLQQAQEITRRLGNVPLADDINHAITELKQHGVLSEARIKAIKSSSRRTTRVKTQ